MEILKDEMARLGGPAFPVVPPSESVFFSGMNLRDYFAAAALQGMLSDPDAWKVDWKDRAEAAYEAADAMIAARERKEPSNG